MQPNYFPKLKDKNFLKQLLRSQMNFVPLVSGHGLTADSFFLLSSFLFQWKLRSTLIAAAILKNYCKTEGEGAGKGEEEKTKFFSLLPRPLPLFWPINLSLGGRKRLVSWFALQNTPALQATISFLQIVSIKARDPFLPFLEPTHPQEQSFFDLVEYYFNIMIVNKFLLHDGKSMVLY